MTNVSACLSFLQYFALHAEMCPTVQKKLGCYAHFLVLCKIAEIMAIKSYCEHGRNCISGIFYHEGLKQGKERMKEHDI